MPLEVMLPGSTMIRLLPMASNLLLDARGGARADRHHGDDRRHADDDAEHGQSRAQPVHAQRAQRDPHARPGSSYGSDLLFGDFRRQAAQLFGGIARAAAIRTSFCSLPSLK